MERKGYIAKLKAWKESRRRKPLILEGARQVGKTWLMTEFARNHYKNVVYARFDKNKLLRGIFMRDFDIDRILHEMEILFHTRIESETTVILFDEIQACKPALTALKYFYEDRPDLHIIAAGSLLGLTYRDDELQEEGEPDDEKSTTGFPVGKVNTMPVHPFTFNEYLSAIGEERIVDEIQIKNWRLLNDLRDHIIDHLRHYYLIGGMPEAVSTYLESHSLDEVKTVHREILDGYRRDISKHAPKSDVRKIEMCWQSIPSQLAKENKKFVYATIKKGGRAAEFRDPLAWLEDAGLVHLNRRVSMPSIPLDSYSNGGFKVYALDVGLLATMSGLAPEVILEGSRIFREFKGALTEQYVYQQLIAETNIKPYYWSTDDSRTEIDFVFQTGMEVCPLEVKAESNVRSQSLKSYEHRFRPQKAYRASMLPYIQQEIPLDEGASCILTNIPLYAIGAIGETPTEPLAS